MPSTCAPMAVRFATRARAASGEREALAAISEADSATVPTLCVLDDLGLYPEAVAALAEALEAIESRPALVRRPLPRRPRTPRAGRAFRAGRRPRRRPHRAWTARSRRRHRGRPLLRGRRGRGAGGVDAPRLPGSARARARGGQRVGARRGQAPPRSVRRVPRGGPGPPRGRARVRKQRDRPEAGADLSCARRAATASSSAPTRGWPPSRSPTRRTSTAASASWESWPRGPWGRGCSASSARRAAASPRWSWPACCPRSRPACFPAASAGTTSRCGRGTSR